tara:strand:+ start:256 stop:1152 length:897 start_codon:yes stop_codon:yes gene_type:complete
MNDRKKPQLTKGSGGTDPERIRFLKNEWLIPFINSNDIKLKNKKILDIGCGGGSSTFAISLSSKKCHVIGIDVELPSINHAKESYKNLYNDLNIEFLHQKNNNSIDFENNQFDIVVFNAVFEHVYLSDRKGLLLESLRVLKKNGYIVIIGTPNKWFPNDSHTSNLWFVPWMPLFFAKYYVLFRNGAIKKSDELAKSNLSIFEKLRTIPKNEWIFRGIRGTGYNEIKKWANSSNIKYKIVNNDNNKELDSYMKSSKSLKSLYQNYLIRSVIKAFIKLFNILKISCHNFLPYLRIIIQKT